MRRKQYELGAGLFATQQSSMHKCAASDDMSGVKKFRGGLHPTEIDAQDRWGNTALALACQRGHTNVVRTLLEDGASLSVQNSKGQSPMHIAVIGGHIETMKILAEYGADSCVRDNTGSLPAHYAAQADDIQALEALLDISRETLNGRMHNGMTPAHTAALFDSPNALRFLHEHSAQCNLLSNIDLAGETCAHKAARVQALRALHYLESIGALSSSLCNYEGDSASHLAKDQLSAWRFE
uniref:Uncharacterized protein n=1 Tax=Aureoumbra lagunensis TaxID=44058 RepID=A0A7S3K6F1_9STRA